MDQMACSIGSLAHIDFQDPVAPLVSGLSLTPDGYGYSLCITDTRAHMRFDIGLCSNRRNEKERRLVWEKEVLTGYEKKKYLLIFHASENRQEIGQRLERFTMCVKMSAKRSGSIEREQIWRFFEIS